MNDLSNSTNQAGDDDQQSKLVSYTGGSKERAGGTQEKTPITEFTKNVDIEPEVESWLEKLEKEDSSLQNSVKDDQTNQVVLDDIDSDGGDDKKFKVILPLTKVEVEKGLKRKVVDSARWMAEWCIRMIKVFHGKVAYKRKD